MKKKSNGYEFPMELPSHENSFDAPILDEQADPEPMDLGSRHHSGIHIDRITSVTPQASQSTGTEAQTTL